MLMHGTLDQLHQRGLVSMARAFAERKANPASARCGRLDVGKAGIPQSRRRQRWGRIDA